MGTSTSRSRHSASVLFAWEMGGGLGHIGPIFPVAEYLASRGHQITVAARDLGCARALFHPIHASVCAAPFGRIAASDRIEVPRSYAHILHNSGYSRLETLLDTGNAWRAIIREVRPSLVVCDHSPTAMLAARAESVPVVAMGTGFCCPPDVSLMPDFRPWLPEATDRLRADERRVLDTVNCVARHWRQPPYDYLAQILHLGSHAYLTTFQELDHYPTRVSAGYWGTWSLPGTSSPKWPARARRRAIVYLKASANVPELLRLLSHLEISVLAYCPGLPEVARRNVTNPRLVFVDRPVDFPTLVRQSDFAVLNAGHGSTCLALLAGKPVLQIPTNLEQAITANTTERLGAGIRISVCDRPAYIDSIARFLDLEPYALAAQRFSARYIDFDSEGQPRRMAAELERIATGAMEVAHGGGNMNLSPHPAA